MNRSLNMKNLVTCLGAYYKISAKSSNNANFRLKLSISILLNVIIAEKLQIFHLALDF